MGNTIRILLVDSSPILRLGLRDFLQQKPDLEVVGEAGDGEEAVRQIEATHPDLVVMDCRLPRMDGAEVVALVLRKCATIILAYSSSEESTCIQAMIAAGAAGYLLKNEPPEHIVEAVRAVTRGEGWFSPAVAARLTALLQKGATHLADLTEREKEILRSLAKGKSNREIAAELGIAERTVRFHLGNIYGKIGVRSRTEAALWSAGYNPLTTMSDDHVTVAPRSLPYRGVP